MTTQRQAAPAIHGITRRARQTCNQGGVLLLLLALLAEASSMKRCCRSPLPTVWQAFVAPQPTKWGVGVLVSPPCGSEKSGSNRSRRAAAGAGPASAGRFHRQLLPPLLGPNGSHDSLGRSPLSYPTESSSSHAPRRGAATPTSWARLTRKASSLAAAAPGPQERRQG
ncbi:unnamed protein product, partial [Pylaiella littoralis]